MAKRAYHDDPFAGLPWRAVIGSFAVIILVLVLLLVAVKQSETGADTAVLVTPSPMASGTLAPEEAEDTAELAIINIAINQFGGLSQTGDREATGNVQGVADELIRSIQSGVVTTDRYGVALTGLYEASGYLADAATADYATDWGSADIAHRQAIRFYQFASSQDGLLAYQSTGKAAGWFGLIGQADAAGKAVGAKKTAKTGALKSINAAATQRTATKPKLAPEWVVRYTPQENGATTSAHVDVMADGTNQIVSSLDVAGLTTVVAQPGTKYNLSGYRLTPFALDFKNGAPPAVAFDKNSGQDMAYTLPMVTIASWKGDEFVPIIPVLDRTKKGTNWKAVGGKVLSNITHGIVKSKEEQVKSKFDLPAEVVQEMDKAAEKLSASIVDAEGIDVTSAANLQNYDAADDLVLVVRAKPQMLNGKMEVLLAPFGERKQKADGSFDKSDTYFGYNMNTVQNMPASVALDDVPVLRTNNPSTISDDEFVFRSKNWTELTVVSDKHDKGTKDADKEVFASPDGTQTSKNFKIRLRFVVTVNRGSGEVTAQYIYRIGDFQINNKKVNGYVLPKFKPQSPGVGAKVGHLSAAAKADDSSFSSF